MIINEKEYVSGKCRLVLPHFTPEKDTEAKCASLMNSFFGKLRDEAVLFSKSSPELRRYTSCCTSDTEGDTVSVTLRLCARRVSAFGRVTTSRRDVFTRWKDTSLAEFSFRDL